ncbi:MAG: SRPBCC family protein [Candidatus Dormibacteraceae bacterium]
MHNSTDRIEKEIVLRAPRSRVWRALADAEEFSAWFGMQIDGAFAPGARVHGRFTLPGHGQMTIEMAIEQMEPESRMSYRWHPYAMEPGVDYSREPTTLVAFQLEEVAGGTQLTVVESGFDRIPAARRAEAFRMNDAGWAEQLENISRYVAS